MDGTTNDFRDMLTERHTALMDCLTQIRRDIDQLSTRVHTQNGRVGAVEAKIAVLEERHPGKQGAIGGAVGGAVAGFLAGLVKP